MLGLGLPAVEPALFALIFVMVRIGAAFIAAPVFGAVAVPLPVRIVLSGAIGILVVNNAPVATPAAVFSLETFLQVVQEALVGLALGFIIQIAFAAPLIASEALGNTMGLGFALSIDPQRGASTPALGTFLMIVMTLLFLALDGHLILVDLLVRSYIVLPPGEAWLTADKLKGLCRRAAARTAGRVHHPVSEPDRRHAVPLGPRPQPVRGGSARQPRRRPRGTCHCVSGDG
jgi:flagellar biosynthesis protein FliR